MTLPQVPVRWRNASSGEETCVDLAHTFKAVRDSKNPDGPQLHVAVHGLLSAAKAGQFDR